MAEAPVKSLADALAALVLGPGMQGDALPSKTFAGACSFRIALPLAGAAHHGLALVTADLRASWAPPPYWATPSTTSLVGGTLRTGRSAAAEAPGALQYSDARRLHAAEGATSFLCLPVLAAAGGPAVAALLLSYPSTAAAPQQELRLALLLAAQLSQRHGGALQEHATRLARAVHPAEHSLWGPGIDSEYPELSSSQQSSDSDASGSGGSSRGDAAGSSSSSSSSTSEARLLSRRRGSRRRGGSRGGLAAEGGAAGWTLSAGTLRFADGQLEARFRRWRHTRMARVDASALLALLAYHAVACLLPPFASCQASRLAAGLLPTLSMLAPLLLLCLKGRKRWYIRHRDHLLACTYLLLACHHAADLAAQLQAAPDGAWRAALTRLEGAWCLVLSLVLQVQFVAQCAMVAGSLALQALLQARWDGWAAAAALRSSPVGSRLRAWPPSVDIRALLLKLLLPMGLAYAAELSARRTFCRAVRASR